jgi:hypothetical protein
VGETLHEDFATIAHEGTAGKTRPASLGNRLLEAALADRAVFARKIRTTAAPSWSPTARTPRLRS